MGRWAAHAAKLTKVPRGYFAQAKTAMLQGDYTNIQRSEEQLHRDLQWDYIQKDPEVNRLLDVYRQTGDFTQLRSRIHTLKLDNLHNTQQIASAPTLPHGSHIYDVLNQDEQLQTFLKAGNISGINTRIRQVFQENKDKNSNFRDAIEYNEQTVPQFNKQGTVVYTGIRDPPPDT